jgi:hypothetical protein
MSLKFTQHLSLQDTSKFTQISIFGLKIYVPSGNTELGTLFRLFPRWIAKIAENKFPFFDRSKCLSTPIMGRVTRGRYYDHDFLRFSTIFSEKMAFFSKINAMINVFA